MKVTKNSPFRVRLFDMVAVGEFDFAGDLDSALRQQLYRLLSFSCTYCETPSSMLEQSWPVPLAPHVCKSRSHWNDLKFSWLYQAA